MQITQKEAEILLSLLLSSKAFSLAVESQEATRTPYQVEILALFDKLSEYAK